MSVTGKLIQSVTGRPIIVTGAGSGLGAATARYLSQHGAKVTILDVNPDHGERVAKEISGIFVKTDVCSEADVKKAIAAADEYGGQPLFGAVNCAGVCPAAKVLGKKGVHSLDIYQKAISINLVGTFNVCRLAAEAMQKNSIPNEAAAKTEADPTTELYEDRGVIVNTASIAAFEGQIGQAAYAASKGGIVAMTLPLARELASHRIRVNTICPGTMRTPLLPPALCETLGLTVPYPQRVGDPLEYAHAVHFLMTNRYMNGECLRLDGAARLTPK